MNWTLRETARALGMDEEEVLRLARDTALPACRIEDVWLFNPVEVQEWAAGAHRRMAGDVLPRAGGVPAGSSGDADRYGLASAIERGGVHHGVPGAGRDAVLDAVADLPGIPPGVDRALLREVLRAREALASTGIGGGIAIPHARDPLVLHVEHPVLLLCFLAQPVEFGAIDGKPVRVLFTLLSPTVPAHLRLLARLAHALHDEALDRLLHAQAPRDAILARLRDLDAAMDAARDGKA